MSMEIDPGRLEEFLGNAEAVVSECRCHIGEDGLRIAAVDAANVLMVEETLHSSAFENYDVSDVRLDQIAFNLKKFTKVLDLADDEPVTLTVETDGDYVIRIQSRTLNHTVSLIDPSSVRSEPDISDDLEEQLRVEAVLEGDSLKRIHRAASLVSDHVSIGANPDVEKFVGKASGDNDTTRIELSESDLSGLDIGELDTTVYSLISTDYMQEVMSPVSGADDDVTVLSDNDMPVIIDFEFADGHGEVRYVIAPRLET